MFQLLVKYTAWGQTADTMYGGRVFEYTDDRLTARFKPDGQLDYGALTALPALFVQEAYRVNTSSIRKAILRLEEA